MTREEAIEEVKNYDSYPNGLSKECRDYIVKALKQEPCEDCIPREYVIALLENKKRTRKEITNRIYEYVQGVSE